MSGLILVSILILIGIMATAQFLFVGSIMAVLPVTHGAMFHPTARVRIATILDHVPMEKGELLVDIGCGTGRVLKAAAKRYPIRAVGYEINPLAYVIARVFTWGNKRISIHWRNFWKEDLGNADVIFCYLFPDVMERLAEKLKRELRAGTRVVSCNFPFPGWREKQILYPPSQLYGDPIFVYGIPDHGDGNKVRRHT